MNVTGAEVFDSEGTLALMVDGVDVAHLSRLTDDDGNYTTTDDEYQSIIDTVVAAFLPGLGAAGNEKDGSA